MSKVYKDICHSIIMSLCLVLIISLRMFVESNTLPPFCLTVLQTCMATCLQAQANRYHAKFAL